jgi:molybdate transport system substrate-binding protein
MRESLLAGGSCELFVTSARVMADLRSSGQLNAEVVGDVGWVQTGLAIRATDPVPDVSTPTGVARALRAAPALFFPDPVQSTAGIHFSKVLEQIGIAGADGVSLKTYPNGATAMRALAGGDHGRGALGCTQVTEILQTEGLRLAEPLPEPYKLTTRYQCALLQSTDGPRGAAQMYELLTGALTAPLREEPGMHNTDL